MMYTPLLAAAALIASTSAIATDNAFSGNDHPGDREILATQASKLTRLSDLLPARLPATHASSSGRNAVTPAVADPEPYAMLLLGMAMIATIVRRRIPHET